MRLRVRGARAPRFRTIGLAASMATAVAAGPAADARAAGAVAFQTWDGDAVEQHLEPGESATASGSGLASSMSGNPALDGSAWAHTGDWWQLHLQDAPEVRIRVEAEDPSELAPGLSVWAIGNGGPFDGGTTGFGGETSTAGFGTPHSFNAFGALGDTGTLWMQSGQGGNARELVGYAIAGPSFLDSTGWGETIEHGAHDTGASDDYVVAVTGLVGAGFAELVLHGVSTGWFTIFVGGTDHSLAGGAFTLAVTSVPEPSTAMMVLLGVGLLARAGRMRAR
jgi:hypothetical protein